MNIPIWLRMLLAVNLLVLAATAAIGWYSVDIAGKVVEDKLTREADDVKETAERTGEFVRAQKLPFSNTMMENLHRVNGTHFVTVRVRDGKVICSSFSEDRLAKVRDAIQSSDQAGFVELRDGVYRFESHEVVASERTLPRRTETLRLYAFASQAEFADARRQVVDRIAQVVGPVIVAASILAVLLALTIVRPIRKLAAEMSAMARHSVADPTEPTATDTAPRRHGPGEVAKLARSFDRLMAHLAETRGDLARHERLATLGKIAASVVHELRNPLSGIRMNIRVLQEELAERDIADESLVASVREIERMGFYLDELTDLASGASAPNDRFELQSQSLVSVRVAEVADAALVVFAGRCRHADVTVDTHYDPAAPHVRADPGRLRQVLINLIVNALDTMPSGGTLTVRVERTPDGGVRCAVADTGGGVQAGQANNLFEPFVTTKRNSVGLGLYVCRRIVEAHGGKIGYDNADDGAAFWFAIPGDSEDNTDNGTRHGEEHPGH